MVVAAATAFTLWQTLGIVAVLLGMPNMAAKVEGVDCNCAIAPLLGEWDVYVPIGGLLLGVWILIPTIVLLACTGVILWRSSSWILDRRNYHRELVRSVLVGAVVAMVVITGIVVEFQMAGGVLSGNTQMEGAPNFRITLTNGSDVDLRSFRGKPIILEFFATWCPHCQTEVPQLKQVQEALGDRVHIISVSTGWRGDDLEAIKRFQEAYGITWPLGMAERQVDQLYGVNLVPKLLVLDAQQQVRMVFTGETGAAKLMETPHPLIFAGEPRP